MQVAELASSFDGDKLLRAVVGHITEDRHLWRINWLKSVLDDLEHNVTVTCDDPASFWEAIGECRAMVKAVNEAIANVHPWSAD